MMYRYETHCHTAPVSKCGKASVEDMETETEIACVQDYIRQVRQGTMRICMMDENGRSR